MSEIPRWPWALVALLGVLVAVQTVRLAWRDVRSRRVLRARARRAAAGERAAVGLLERAGYRIADQQVARTLEYGLDGAPCRVEVRADYLVERGGELFVAEVKTGKEAPKLSHRPTRRQLLEYAHAFGTEGVLLVDAEQGRVHRVRVPGRPREAPSRLERDLALLLAGALLGALFSLAALWHGR